MVVIYQGTSFEVNNLVNILENDGINTKIKDETVSHISPWIISAGGNNPVKLLVEKKQTIIAKHLIQNYLNDNENISYNSSKSYQKLKYFLIIIFILMFFLALFMCYYDDK